MEETREEKVGLRKLGKRVQALRRERGISQEKFASLVGISRVYMGYIEQGRSSPAVGKLYRMAKALRVPLKALFEV